MYGKNGKNILGVLDGLKKAFCAEIILNSVVFWDVTQRRFVSNRRFGATYRPYFGL